MYCSFAFALSEARWIRTLLFKVLWINMLYNRRCPHWSRFPEFWLLNSYPYGYPSPVMLTISDVSKSYGPQTLFEDVSLQISRGERVGLIGPNGAGKSTLFSLILGVEEPDKGTVTPEKNVVIGHLPQESAPAGDGTVLDLAIAVTPEIASLQRRMKVWDSEHPSETDHHENIHARYDALGGHLLEPKAKRILAGLSFREKDFGRALREMSGGWVMRAHLARLLTLEPDFLMLDEPTNHLDLESLQWFQEYLRGYPGGILMISHDREFP